MRETFELWINGRIYGKGPREYMIELIRDYVETNDMYSRDSVDFTIVRGTK